VQLLLSKFVVGALMFVDLTTDNIFQSVANCQLPIFYCLLS
jgi:hypothetical protein